MLAIILFISKFNKTVLIKYAVRFKERLAAIELPQFERSMLAFLHRPCELDGSAGYDVDIRFKPYGVDAEPTCMTVTVPVAGFLAA